jgi:hypothetical protein
MYETTRRIEKPKTKRQRQYKPRPATGGGWIVGEFNPNALDAVEQYNALLATAREIGMNNLRRVAAKWRIVPGHGADGKYLKGQTGRRPLKP